MSNDDHNVADYEEVLRVLPESFRQSWKDNPEVLVYLAELGSLGLQRLSQEPDRLSEERVSVLEQTQDLAFHNYKTFIQAAECSHKIFQDFNIIESRLDSLANKLPDFKGKCGDFGKEAQKINARWRQASSTLAKHPQLLEFLEMSQLMDTYVRNGYYDEALELSAYVKRLERKHVDIPLIKSIVHDVQVASNSMLSNLLTKLRTNIQLPDCLKVVGYLRRMDVFNESELRIKFLQARDAWFHKVITSIDKADYYEHVIKVIESSRVHLFDITTQYRAIFSDDDPLLLVREESKGNCSIFHSWITWKISWFLSILEKDISADLGGRIDSVLAQCMYFGLSFSRVNIDFRPLLVPIFQNVVLKKFCSTTERAAYKFEKGMENFAFTMYTNTNMLVTSLSEDSLQPPISLLDFHPLAQYCNDVLSAFNELKLCCSFSMSQDVITALSNSLNRIINTLLKIHRKKFHRMSGLEIESFQKFCFLLSSDLIPHINKCLGMVFPPESISQTLGITSLEFKKFESLCKINAADILEPLQAVLPSKLDEDVGITFTIHGRNAEVEHSQTNIDVEHSVQNTEIEHSLQNTEIEHSLQNTEVEHLLQDTKAEPSLQNTEDGASSSSVEMQNIQADEPSNTDQSAINFLEESKDKMAEVKEECDASEHFHEPSNNVQLGKEDEEITSKENVLKEDI